MQVFVEYVVIDNMIIDTLILLITCKLNKIDTKKMENAFDKPIWNAGGVAKPTN